MKWTNPEFESVKMDAEIGSYQEDDSPIREPQFCENIESEALTDK